MTQPSYLTAWLAPLAPLLARPDLTDLWINTPGEAWTETLTGEITHHHIPALDEALLWRLAHQIASLSHQGISRAHPLLAATLPDGARVQIVAPPATRGAMAIAIRKHVMPDLTLADLAASGTLADTAITQGPPPPRRLQAPTETTAAATAALLTDLVRARRNILISGGTATGKTTLLNALLKEIPPAERLILIEDTAELRLVHANAVGLIAVRGTSDGTLGEAAVTADDLLQAALRMRPDRIILGEVRGTEAMAFLRAVNTGHPGSLTTIHADSPEGAIEQLALIALQSGLPLRRADVVGYVLGVIDAIVQVERHHGRRRIARIALTAAPAAHPATD